MKTDLNSLKKELGKLTDIAYLRKEFSRVSAEIRNFDVHRHLPRKAKVRIEKLEERFIDALQSLRDLQHQVDSNLDRFISLVKTRTTAMQSARQSTRRSSKKAAKVTAKRRPTGKKTAKRAKR